jgi:hypothetical protein
MVMPFANILQDEDLPVHSVGVYTHFNNIVFYVPSERMRTERVNVLSFPDIQQAGRTVWLTVDFTMV